ncbi:hypothetical protein C1646_766205 [Rhizophagus diaphanus]|nr:hypothetical protein C1646_766205 [Rhizophagus diaphanus] [Rhizophagus sp. MUCL 43196]
MSIMIGDFRYSDGFGGVEITDTGLIALIAFAVFFLWIERVNFVSPLNTKFILLTESKNIKTKDSTYSETATNPLNGQELNVEMKANFDSTDRNNNSFSYFPTAMIAFMGGVYEEAATKGRQALLRFRANQIANYEALYHIHFPSIEIYFIILDNQKILKHGYDKFSIWVYDDDDDIEFEINEKRFK